MISVSSFSVSDLVPQLVDRCGTLMSRFYRDKFGLDAGFERYTAAELSRFLGGFDARRDGFWYVRSDNGISGCAAVDGRLGDGSERRIAEFRWFYLGADLRGLGLGHQMLSRALRFACDAGYDGLRLTTHADLAAAVHLYERMGFRLADVEERDFFSRRLTFSIFERGLEPGDAGLGARTGKRVPLAPSGEALSATATLQ